MLNGSLQYPAYPFTHDGSASPDWPEENWGSMPSRSPIRAAKSRSQQPGCPNCRQPYVTALSNGYVTLAAAYARENPHGRRSIA